MIFTTSEGFFWRWYYLYLARRSCENFFWEGGHVMSFPPKIPNRSISQVVTTFFQQIHLHTSHYYVFWGADSESDLKNRFRKKMTIRAICKILKIPLKVKKTNVKIIPIRGLKYVKWWEDYKSRLKIQIT